MGYVLRNALMFNKTVLSGQKRKEGTEYGETG